jgi:tartrate dehydratase beta subunit/fumarate hydratase class I family protein
LVLTCISLLSFIFTKNEAGAFYLLHNRFFEISVGGLATLKQQEIKSNKNVANISLLLLFI